MARKQLIKGANAAAVEARISRVPADIDASGIRAAPSIFGALKAMEAGASAELPARVPAKPRAPAKLQAQAKPKDPAKQARIGPSDFSPNERDAIMRCCRDYRNRLPTYLLAVQKEVRIIDSVIEKCRTATRGKA
jgi:hypothetical protein